jgi:transcriptional regulator with XRE-family HTH domain
MNVFVRTAQPGAALADHDPQDRHPVDRQVGLRIRMRRKELGVSQEKLAEALGLTFQQIQKYERATNRVSASKLFEFARTLKTHVSYFYGDLSESAETGAPPTASPAIHDFLLTPEGPELAALFQKLPRRVRRKLMELVRVLAEPETGLEGEAAGDEAAELANS